MKSLNHSILALIILLLSSAAISTEIVFGDGSDGILALDGQWSFVQDHFIEPRDGQTLKQIGKATELDVKTVTASGVWNDYYIVEWDNPIQAFLNRGKGFGTYYTRVKLPQSYNCDNLAIQTNRIKMAYRMYIDGKLVREHGKPGTTKDTTSYLYYPQIVGFPPLSDCHDFEIGFHVANFIYTKGGIDDPVLIGNRDSLAQTREFRIGLRSTIVGMVLLAAMMAIGWYISNLRMLRVYTYIMDARQTRLKSKHEFMTDWNKGLIKSFYTPYRQLESGESALATTIRKTRAQFIFALVVIGWGVRTVTESEKIINILFQQLTPIVTLRLDLAFVYFAWPLLLIYTEAILPKSIHRRIYRANFIWMCFAFPTGIISLYFSGYVLVLSHLYLLGLIFYLAIICTHRTIVYWNHPEEADRRRSFHALLSTVTVLVFLATINDIMYEIGTFRSFGYISNYAIALYTLVNIVLLGSDMGKLANRRDQEVQDLTAKARQEMEQSNARVLEYKDHIENQIHDRILTPISLLSGKFNNLDILSLPVEQSASIKALKADLSMLYHDISNFNSSKMSAHVTIQQVGLAKTIENLAKTASTQNQMIVADVDPRCTEKLPIDCQNEVWIIIQECINNCKKHSNAESVIIRGKCRRDYAEIVVADTGNGLPENYESGNGLGLQSMKNRAETNNFDLQIVDTKEGLSVVIRIPYESNGQ